MREYQLFLPINTEVFIPKDDSVRLLDEILDQLDYSQLNNSYSRLGRNPSITPKTLFKVLVYAYMNNIYSTRMIEKACKRDINFIWLLAGEKAPDHNNIARFRTGRLAPFVENLFSQLVVILADRGEIAYKNLFVDGTKLEANANKYSFVWRKTTEKNEAKLQENLKNLIYEINEQYQVSFEIDNKIPLNAIDEIIHFLEHHKNLMGIEFVYGKGKRKNAIQRQIEKLTEFKTRQQKYNENNELFQGRNSYSKTDTDATFMHMKDDHMRNSQLKPGYNVQIGVEGEYIVGVGIFSERSDQLTLKPFLENLKKQLPIKYENIIADAGYESEENYNYLEIENQNSFIKPSNYEISKKGSFKKKINLRENMTYDADKDEYICHNDKKLKYIGDTKRKSKSGYESKIKIYECESCEQCSFKEKCTKAKGNRKLSVAEDFIKYRNESLKNIISEEGIKLRINRSIQVEGAFGVLKEDYAFRRFFTRGKANVKVEFILLSLGFNLNKLHKKIINNRLGISMFEPRAA